MRNFNIGLFKRCFITTSGVVIKNEALRIVGLFDTNPLFRGVEDHDFLLRCVEKNLNFTFVREIYCWYRKNRGSQETANLPRILEKDLAVLLKHKMSYPAPRSSIRLAILRHSVLLAFHRQIAGPKKYLRNFFGKISPAATSLF